MKKAILYSLIKETRHLHLKEVDVLPDDNHSELPFSTVLYDGEVHGVNLCELIEREGNVYHVPEMLFQVHTKREKG